MIYRILTGKAKVRVYDHCKYDGIKEDEMREVEYSGVAGFEVISDSKRVAELEAETDRSSIDEYHEYLRLYLENGEEATFRNSHADLFAI